jgi:hypothetical protein
MKPVKFANMKCLLFVCQRMTTSVFVELLKLVSCKWSSQLAGCCLGVLLCWNLFCAIDNTFLCYAEDNILTDGKVSDVTNVSKKDQLPQAKQTPAKTIDRNDKSYKARQRLLQLNEVHRLLPREKDVKSDDYLSSNYGFVRPLLRELYLGGVDALPALIDHFDNTNYLYAYREYFNLHNPRWRHETVGTEARKLFEYIVEPLGPYHTRGHKGTLSFVREHKNIKEWYLKNRHKSLAELQLDAIDYYIQVEKELGFPDGMTESNILNPLMNYRHQLRNGIPIILQGCYEIYWPPLDLIRTDTSTKSARSR